MTLRLDARYRLLTDDFDAIDHASDALMDALMAMQDIANPDVAVSLTEPSLEVWLDLYTDDVLEAFAIGAQRLAEAFTEAGLNITGFTITGTADIHAEPVLV